MKYLLLILLLILSCKKDNNPDYLLRTLLEENSINYYLSNPYDYFNNENIKKEIIKIIRNTKEILYIFCYGLDEKDIILAIKEIYDKGIPVKIIGSKDQNYELLKQYNIPYELKQNSSIQHIKMILSDYKILFSGTGNFTTSGIFYNSNLFFKLNIPEEKGKLIIKKFYELNYQSPIVIVNNFYKIKILQSPENGKEIQSIINNSILNAKESISFYIFSFYDPTIMNSLLFKRLNGFTINGILDKNTINKNNTLLLKFINRNQFQNLFFYKDNYNFSYIDPYDINHGGKFHHKTILIDNYILTGSYNYSINARDYNSEIFFWIYDPINIFSIKKKYQYLYHNSSLIIPENENLELINDAYINIQLCQLSDGDNVYFQGKNAFFFMDYIQYKDCPERNSYSSGIISNKSDGFIYSKGYSIKNFYFIKQIALNTNEFINCNGFLCDPCEIYHCQFMPLFYINFNTNYFILNYDIPSNAIYLLWNGKEILKMVIDSKNYINNKFYYFFSLYDSNNQSYNQTINEGILFINNQKELLFTCFYSNQLRDNLRTFLNLMEWYDEKFLNLSTQCFKLTY
ncbi:MAG: hypothetical protein KatS3mg129_1797 [Leptospiraceae bacterium]|nr:MAG: hypothetical protein KatS3mg129_1797 [Leptospiraceae bacterium]